MRLAVGTGLRSPCRASCGRSRPLVCTRMPPGRLIIAWRAKKRAEWLALSGLLYLTNWTNSRVRSTHLLHTKSPFSRFFGCRRQKSENIVVSARGRRTPQAPTLRILGCANARKYDYKSSSLYSQSNHQRAAVPLSHRKRHERFMCFGVELWRLLSGSHGRGSRRARSSRFATTCRATSRFFTARDP